MITDFSLESNSLTGKKPEIDQSIRITPWYKCAKEEKETTLASIPSLLEKYIDPKKELQKTRRASNSYLKKEHKDRINIPGMDTTIAYTINGVNYYDNKLPLGRFTKEQLDNMLRNKYFRNYVYLESHYLQSRRFRVLRMKTVAWLVLDIDDKTKEEVETILKEIKTFLRKYNYVLVPSMSGTGCHIWMCIDLSFLNQDPYANNKEEGENIYKTGDRYFYYREIAYKIAKRFQQETGIKVDIKVSAQWIACNPEENAIINEYFKDKKPTPIVFDDEDIPEASEETSEREKAALQAAKILKDKKTVNKKKNTEVVEQRMTPFFEETDNFLDAYDMGYDVICEVKEHSMIYCDANEVDDKRYKEAFSVICNNREHFKNSIINYMATNSIYSIKTIDLGIGVDGVLKLFGYDDKHSIKTYLRHIFLYMLNMKIHSNYVYKVKTATYDFMEENRYKSFFTAEFLKENWWVCKKNVKIPTEFELAEQFGNGNTWATIQKYTPFLVSALGVEAAIDLLVAGLDLSTANDKNNRRKQIAQFAYKCEKNPYRDKLAA
jgi:hypothetical protein